VESVESPETVALDAVHVISDIETLRVVADRTRLDLLDLLRSAPRTVKELATALDLPATKLYYHMRLLEEHRLIRVVGTRLVSGILEKSYQTSAYRFTVDHALLPGEQGNAPLAVMLSVILDEAASEIQHGVECGLIDLAAKGPGSGGMTLGRIWIHMTPAQAEQFDKQVQTTLRAIAQQAATEPGADVRLYEVLLGVYPTEHQPDAGHLIVASAEDTG
jgi:DNA-binding transcriptional ArsR family regulator